MITVKRIYDPPGNDDDYRILIDRLWPRGFTKERAKVDLWMKEIAPSTELRKWYHHNPERWNEFKNLYRMELTEKKELMLRILHLEKEHGNITVRSTCLNHEYQEPVAPDYTSIC